LYFEDYEYEMIPSDNPEGLFNINLRKINQTIKKSYHTGDVEFYGKPWEYMYTFKAHFQDGKLERVDLINKE
jgi:hypothetical protein